MTKQEQQLIDAIKTIPGFSVIPGRNSSNVIVVHTRANGVSQRSVWLDRSHTIESLQEILDKAIADSFIGKKIVHMGHAWEVIGTGAQRDGNTFCHLANLYQFRQQKNGRVPVQIADWVDTAVLKASKA